MRAEGYYGTLAAHARRGRLTRLHPLGRFRPRRRELRWFFRSPRCSTAWLPPSYPSCGKELLFRGPTRHCCYYCNHPAFCLKKYFLSHQKIAKSLFFVLTYASCPYILNGHAAFSSKNTPNQAKLTHLKQRIICMLVGMLLCWSRYGQK